MLFGERVLFPIRVFGNREDHEEDRREGNTREGSYGLRSQVDEGRREQNEHDRKQTDGYFSSANGEVRGNLPAALTFVLEAQDEHRQTIERETPDHAEGVRFTEHIDVAAARQNGEDLQQNDHVDDAGTCSVLAVGKAEPIGEDAVFGDTVEDAIGSDDRGVDGAREDEEPDHDDKCAEDQAQDERPPHVHGEAGDQIVFVNGNADSIRNQHDGQQRGQSGENEAVDGDDDRGFFQILELGMSEFTIDLGERFFAAHGQHGVAEGNQDSEQSEHSGKTLLGQAVTEKAERFFGEMKVLRNRKRNGVVSRLDEGKCRPGEQDDHHDGGDLHDAESFLAGLLDALGIFPPVIDRDG